jgi:G3E family GTPase
MEQKKVLQKIPTNIITGFLGVGKTTTILTILQHKPAHERWLVIVNEFGEVSIDHIAFEGSSTEQQNLAIKYVAGGCICCTANLPLQTTLTQSIRQVKPHRILIEPTGIAHPEAIIDVLQSEFLSKVIDLRATLCLINPQQLVQDKYFDDDVYQDQITLADVLIANKIDLAGKVLTEKFVNWAKALFPPKIVIAAVEKGDIDLSWLDIEPYPHRKALHTDAHAQMEHTPNNHNEQDLSIPLVGQPLRREGHSLNTYGCGWVFSPDEIFQKNQLLAVLDSLKGFERIKGVFRISEKHWIFVNKTGEEPLNECSIAYRRDSRIEIIALKPAIWQILEKQIMDCRKLDETSIDLPSFAIPLTIKK